MPKRKESGLHHDFRLENPSLHLLYTKWAVNHLAAIDDCIDRLSAFSNLNLHPAMEALQKERRVLVEENPAYADGNEILQALRTAEQGFIRYAAIHKE